MARLMVSRAKKRSRLTLGSRSRQSSGVKCCSGGGGSCVPWHPLLVKGHDGEGGRAGES